MKPYQRENIKHAKELRKNMTPWERKLWYEYLRTHSVRFQRQKAIGNYIVDFYCAKAGLCIELDGGGHYYEEQTDYDDRRTKALEAMNLIVLRFDNTAIDREFPAVCETIDRKVRERIKASLLRGSLD